MYEFGTDVMDSNVVINGINGNIITHAIGLACCLYSNWGILINLSAAVCAVRCRSGNINKLYCKLVMCYIKVMPFVYSKLF